MIPFISECTEMRDSSFDTGFALRYVSMKEKERGRIRIEREMEAYRRLTCHTEIEIDEK